MKLFVLVLIVLIVLSYIVMAIVLVSMGVDSRKLGEYRNTLSKQNEEIMKMEGGENECQGSGKD